MLIALSRSLICSCAVGGNRRVFRLKILFNRGTRAEDATTGVDDGVLALGEAREIHRLHRRRGCLEINDGDAALRVRGLRKSTIDEAVVLGFTLVGTHGVLAVFADRHAVG
ncbi:MAG: hypothetical protein EBT46_02260 [Actinobacteria bacterium]|nr:hypothetical protein [Actinomycetota bacterium]